MLGEFRPWSGDDDGDDGDDDDSVTMDFRRPFLQLSQIEGERACGFVTTVFRKPALLFPRSLRWLWRLSEARRVYGTRYLAIVLQCMRRDWLFLEGGSGHHAGTR